MKAGALGGILAIAIVAWLSRGETWAPATHADVLSIALSTNRPLLEEDMRLQRGILDARAATDSLYLELEQARRETRALRAYVYDLEQRISFLED